MHTCYDLLKQIAASLWITSFDNQLAASLLTTCNSLVVNKLSQAMRTHPDIGLLITGLLQDVSRFLDLFDCVLGKKKQKHKCFFFMKSFLLQELNRKLKKEKDECDQLRAMLSEESKDDDKQNKLVRELQRKVKDLNIVIEDLENKWRIEKDKVNKLNSDIFIITGERTKFQKLSKGLREDVDDLTNKYTREKSEVERLEEEISKLRREHTDSKNVVDVESVVSSFEEKIRRLTAECDSFEEKYKYEKREKTEFEDKFHRVKSEVSRNC